MPSQSGILKQDRDHPCSYYAKREYAPLFSFPERRLKFLAFSQPYRAFWLQQPPTPFLLLTALRYQNYSLGQHTEKCQVKPVLSFFFPPKGEILHQDSLSCSKLCQLGGVDVDKITLLTFSMCFSVLCSSGVL